MTQQNSGYKPDPSKSNSRVDRRKNDEIDTTSPGAEGGLNTVNEGIEEVVEQAQKNGKSMK